MTQEDETTQKSAPDHRGPFTERFESVIHFERPTWRRILFVLREIFPTLRNAWRDSRFL